MVSFSVQRSRTAFSNVAVDQSIKQTLNRDTKTKGGIVGFSRNPAAVKKWMVNDHHRADITRQVKNMAGMNEPTAALHKECRKSHLLEKEKAVQTVMCTISSMQNPFAGDENGVMYNISSGRTAPDSVSNDLLTARTTGE